MNFRGHQNIKHFLQNVENFQIRVRFCNAFWGVLCILRWVYTLLIHILLIFFVWVPAKSFLQNWKTEEISAALGARMWIWCEALLPEKKILHLGGTFRWILEITKISSTFFKNVKLFEIWRYFCNAFWCVLCILRWV